jgi:predicted TIM-barrel fold metal-dependent hydrolase
MRVDDMILVSVDDHVIEPPDMFERHVPAKFADDAPKVVRTADGLDEWVFQGITTSTPLGMCAVVGRPREEWGWNPGTFAEMRPGCYDIHQRVRDMDVNGVLGSMCFPTMAGFNARTFVEAADKELSLVMLQAYNDWHIDDWCGTYPGRFIPLAIVPMWDVELVASEIRRTAAKGARGVSFVEAPHAYGLPSFHSDYWDPMFQALCDEDVVLCCHIGGGGNLVTLADDAPIDNQVVLPTQLSVMMAQDLLFGPVLRKFPSLRVALSEGGVGWIPYYLDRADRHYTNQTWIGQDFGDKLPSEVFKEHVLACFITDPSGLMMRHRIGVERVSWECDYPHTDSTWPDSAEMLMSEMRGADVPDDEINMITYENSCRFFRWDPFAGVAKERATVGALKALATDVDLTVRSRYEFKARYEAEVSA